MTQLQTGGILIVDDNEMNRDICLFHLEELDVHLNFAEDGQQGIKLAEKTIPDLILLDIMMPIVDGFEMLRHLKSKSTLKDIPVLMLTAKSETDTVVEALELGANDYLKKPFEGEELIARAKTLLRARKLELQVAADLKAGALMQERFLTDAAGTTNIFTENNYNIEVYNRAQSLVSGDFYYSFTNHNGNPALFLGDSCGHGLSAALISMRIIGLLQQVCNTINSPAASLSKLNQDITGLLPASKFVAAASIFFEKDRIVLSNGAQPYPIICRDNNLEEIELDAMPLGINPITNYKELVADFNKGDKLILYTDGIIEALNCNEEVFGKERLMISIEQFINSENISKMSSSILSDVNTFIAGNDHDDDITLIIIEKC